MTDAALADAPAAAAPPDYFEQLGDDAKGKFPAQPPAAQQPCPTARLKAWRDENKVSIDQTVAAQRDLLKAKKAALARWNEQDQADFKTSFGTTTDEAKATISARIDRMLAVNSKLTVDNFSPAEVAKPGRFAYVFRTDTTHNINLDSEFYEAAMTGVDSKPGALSHEMSHFDDIGATFDKFKDYADGNPVYGSTASHLLATTRPDLALQHADSFEYYLEGAP